MGTRFRLVMGSLVGAVVLHVVMVACSGDNGATPGDAAVARDASTLDAMSDAVASGDLGGAVDIVRDRVAALVDAVVDAETRDAHAGGDGGVPTCTCTPPAPSTTFAFTFDRGRGEETPDGPYSRATVTVETTRGMDGVPVRVVPAGVLFYRGDQSGGFHCSARVNTEFALATTTRCTFTLGGMNTGTTFVADDRIGLIEGGQVVVFEQERIELRYRSIRLCENMTNCMTVRNVVFRVFTPGARYRDIPNAYRP